MIRFPNNMRALNICRTSDGWQASLQTDEHATNAFSVAMGATAQAAIAAVCVVHLEIPATIAPPRFT